MEDSGNKISIFYQKNIVFPPKIKFIVKSSSCEYVYTLKNTWLLTKFGISECFLKFIIQHLQYS